MNLRRGTRLGALLCALLIAPAAWASPAQDVFAEIQRLQAQGRFREALSLAEDWPEPLERAQARLFVLHHAGDLAGALAAGLAGLEQRPGDPWLLERSTTLALDLGAADLAASLLARLDAAVEGSQDREAWAPKLAELGARNRDGSRQQRAMHSSLRRARGTVLGLGLACLCALIALGLRRGAPGAASG